VLGFHFTTPGDEAGSRDLFPASFAELIPQFTAFLRVTVSLYAILKSLDSSTVDDCLSHGDSNPARSNFLE
jgi:hypothetical protein